MSFDVGINFRYGSGYVTDPAGTTYCVVGAEAYPQTRGGLTFGWTASIGGNGRDRDNTFDPRIAGVHFATDTIGAPIKFRIDLPSAGATDIYCAIGDSAGNNSYLEVFDNTSSLGVLVTDSFTGTFFDATDTGYSAANWPASNAKATKTFSTTTAIFNISPGLTSGAKNYAVAHLRVVQAASGGSVGSASGTGAASGVGISDNAQAGSAAGIGAAAGTGASINAQFGSSSGTSAASGVGASDFAGVGSSSGTGTASGVGGADIPSVGSSSGTSTADGVGTSSTGSYGTASGSATLNATGASTVDSVGSAAGIASVSGVSASDASTVASASGSATVSGVGDSIVPGSAVGTASGLSSVSGVGASVVAAVGSADGSAVAVGKGASTGGNVEHFAGGYVSREERAERVRKKRVELGIIEEEKPSEGLTLKQFEISNLAEKPPVLGSAKKKSEKRIIALEQERVRRNEELKRLIQMEIEREEEQIIKLLMEM